MKKTLIITISLIAVLMLASCSSKEPDNMETTTVKTDTITVENEIKEGDVWIIPNTQENLKTSVWGKATVAKIAVGESRETLLCEPGDEGLYLFRMIDTDEFYYSANGIALDTGDTLVIKGSDESGVTLEVKNEKGTVINSYDVFSARL